METGKLIKSRNNEERKKYLRDWRGKNHEKALKLTRDWRKTHLEQVKTVTKKWRIANKDKVKFINAARRARKKQAKIERFLVVEIYERDGWICQLCKKKVNKKLRYPDPLSPSLDHIVPISNGGSHTRDNVQLAHYWCNVQMGVRGVKQTRLF